MAKHKYEKKTVIDAVGLLDIKEDRIVLSIDGIDYDFMSMAKEALGTEVHFKSDMIEE